MRPLRRLRLYLAIGYAYAALIVHLTLTSTPPAGPELPYFDKLGHLGAYALLMQWFGQLAAGARQRRVHAAAFVALGAGLEVLQGLGGVRQMELADGLANAVGVGLGYLATRGSGGRLLEKLEGGRA